MVVMENCISTQTVQEVAEALNWIRYEIRSRAGLLAGLGGSNEIDRLIDTSLAPLVMVAGTGGFDSIEDAVSIVSEDLRLAYSE